MGQALPHSVGGPLHSIIVTVLAFTAISAHPAPVNQSHELRRALVYLNDRPEIREFAQSSVLKTVGSAVTSVGVAAVLPPFLAPLLLQGGPHTEIMAKMLVTGAALISVGVVMNVAGRLVPIVRTRLIGEDGAKYVRQDGMGDFFTLPIERQHRLAGKIPELEVAVIKLAASYGFVYGTSGEAPGAVASPR